MAVQSELEQTKLYLLEVIDECVFVERQRELSEKRYSAQLEREKKAHSDLVAALVSLLHYNAILENEVLLPSVCTLHTYKPVFLKLLESKRRIGAVGTQVTDEILKSDLDAFLAQNIGAAPSGPVNCSVDLKVDQLVDAASQIVLRLSQGERRLARELDKIHDVLHNSSIQQEDALRTELRDMKTRVDELQDYISKKSLHTGECAPIVSSVIDASAELQEHKYQQDARMKAFEMTIAALNAELATCQYSSQRDSQEATRTIQELRRTLDEERTKHAQLQKENDAVLNRLASEMEQLIVENARLKAQLVPPPAS